METSSNTQMNFKYGQKVYSLISLRSGMVSKIDLEAKKITIDKGGEYGEETLSFTAATLDVEKILDLLREQVEEYKESFFRVKNTLNKQKINRF